MNTARVYISTELTVKAESLFLVNARSLFTILSGLAANSVMFEGTSSDNFMWLLFYFVCMTQPTSICDQLVPGRYHRIGNDASEPRAFGLKNLDRYYNHDYSKNFSFSLSLFFSLSVTFFFRLQHTYFFRNYCYRARNFSEQYKRKEILSPLSERKEEMK